MKKLFLLFVLMLTVCSTAMAEDLYLESEVGTIGTLNGREAMVVDLGGTIGKVAVAIMNVGAEGQQAKYASVTFGTKFNLGDANDPDKNGLTDGWYVPSKAEMEALKKNLTPNKNLHCVEWKVTDNATLYLPTWHSSSSTPYYGYYVTSDRVKEDDTWKCWIYFFNFYDSDNTFGGNYFEKDDEQETEGCLIRPFHKLPTPNKIYYTSSDSKIVTPYNQDSFGGVRIVSNVYDEKTGKGCITFDGAVTTIGLRAFYKCGNLISINLPDGVESIGKYAFYICSSLTSINIPDGVTSIGTSAFYECKNLTSITLPNGLKTIDTNGFCVTGLRRIELPGSITFINNNAFAYCNDLITITFKGTEPPTAIFGGAASPFLGAGSIIDGSLLLVPGESVDRYKAAGYPNVWPMEDNWAMRVINTLLDGMSTFSEEEQLTIETSKTIISNAKDFATIYDEIVKTISIINLRKAKDAAFAQLENLTASLTDKGKATLQATIDNAKTQINSATDKATVDKEFELIKAKIEAINSYYMFENDLTLTQEERDALIQRILEGPDKETVVNEIDVVIALIKEPAKELLRSCWGNYPQDVLENYISQIDNSISKAAIDEIVKNALSYLDSQLHITIGDVRYKIITDNTLGMSHFIDYLHIPDAKSIVIPKDLRYAIAVNNFSFSRTLPEGVWQCWYEPFDYFVDTERFDAAEVAGILFNDKNEPVVCFKKLANGERMWANTIYVIRAKVGHGNIEINSSRYLDTGFDKSRSYIRLRSAYDEYYLKGYLGDETLPFGDINDVLFGGMNWYTLNDKGQFSLRKPTDTLKPQRFWLTVAPVENPHYYKTGGGSSAAKQFIDFTVLGDEETTGMEFPSISSPEVKKVIYDLQGQKVTSIQKGQVYIMNGKKFIAK